MIVYLYRVGRNLNRATRLCEAMGIARLVLVDCNDAYTKGNLYQARSLPVERETNLPDSSRTVALVPPRHLHDATLTECRWRGATGIVVGGETSGLPPAERSQRVAVPMYGAQVEYTVEAALAIALWEWRRSKGAVQTHHGRDVAIDLDGTLLVPTQRYRRGSFAPPASGAAEAIATLRRAGRKVVVHTARPSSERSLIAAHLQAHGVIVDDIVCGKPPALAYIDDKAIRFRGDWHETLRELEGRS